MSKGEDVMRSEELGLILFSSLFSSLIPFFATKHLFGVSSRLCQALGQWHRILLWKDLDAGHAVCEEMEKMS